MMVFGKTPLANRSLEQQFARHTICKRYVFLTDRPPTRREFTVQSKIIRAGDRQVSGNHGKPAETRFRVMTAAGGPLAGNLEMAPRSTVAIEAWPVTGRTHQIRVHAADQGSPVLGDVLYKECTPFPRVCLHAAELTLTHPASGAPTTFAAPVDFGANARLVLREAVIDAGETSAYRLIHGASDGRPDWYVDRLGDYLLSQSDGSPPDAMKVELAGLMKTCSARGACHKTLMRHVRGAGAEETSPKPVLGTAPAGPFVIRENGIQFELSFDEGYSTGLFLDQRDNRRRLLTGHVAAGFPLFDGPAAAGNPVRQILNMFAYTCGFSVCAARAGMITTSVDLSRKYLEWGRRNFALNGLDAAAHDFIFGDGFEWLRRLAKKEHRFDLVVLDPPTFSQSKVTGAFRAEKDFGKLVEAAILVLAPGGVLFASTNAASLAPEKFLADIEKAVERAGRNIERQHYYPQPLDMPVSRSEPAYLKTVWLRLK